VDTKAAVWLLLLLAFVAANAPFLNERLFAVLPLRRLRGVKPVWLRLLELLSGYFAVGFVAYALEGHFGDAHRQGWEFYAITVCLFLTLAFPGFVMRYLGRARHLSATSGD
jgi:hypothetical protein